MEGKTQTSSQQYYVFTKFDKIPELQVPSLCEIWTWQGDTSVLPFKWAEVLNSVIGNNDIDDLDDEFI